MKNIFLFNKTYLFWTIFIFLTEVYIALYVHDAIIRPYIGDTLVVMLIYCFIKSFFSVSVLYNALGVLLFSFLVETMQYLKLVELLDLQNNKLARVVIGTSFAWMDIMAYILGFVVLLGIEIVICKKKLT